MTRWAFLLEFNEQMHFSQSKCVYSLSASVCRFDCGMQVQTGLLTAAMNGDMATLQRLGDLAPAVVPFICNKVIWAHLAWHWHLHCRVTPTSQRMLGL